MNILFYYDKTFNPQKGGIARVCENLARGFANRGYKLFFVTLSDEEYQTIGQQIVLPDTKNICSERNITEFEKFVNDNKIDFILSQSSYIGEYSKLPYLVKKRTNVKLIYTFHTTPYFNSLSIAELSFPILPSERTFAKEYRRIMRCLLKKTKKKSKDKKIGRHIKNLYSMADGITFLSNAYIDDVQKIATLPDVSKLFAIGNPNSYKKEDVKITPKENTIIFVGRLSHEKHPEKVLLIWKRIQHLYPSWNLKIIGNGILDTELEYLIRKLKLERCSLEGTQKPEPYYQKAKIILVPSDYEGFPLVITEALQYKVAPVVFHSFNALRDILSEGINGMSAKPYDLEEFQAKLQLLMDDENHLAKMVEIGQKNVEENFNIDVVVQKWEDLFSHLSK